MGRFPRVTASITYGCGLHSMWVQPHNKLQRNKDPVLLALGLGVPTTKALRHGTTYSQTCRRHCA